MTYENNDFGKLLLPPVEKTIAAEGATLAGSRALDPKGQDAAEVAQALAAQKPQAVLLVAAGPPVVAYVRANRAHLGVPMYTLSLLAVNNVTNQKYWANLDYGNYAAPRNLSVTLRAAF